MAIIVKGLNIPERGCCDCYFRRGYYCAIRTSNENVKYELDHYQRPVSCPIEEQKDGKWVLSFGGQFTGGAYWCNCSECHHTVPGGLQSGYRYCPNCGAKMEEE